MAVSLTGSGITYGSGNVQLNARPIIKHRMCSATTSNQVVGTSWTYLDGCQIDMGVPKSSLNWYRIEFYNCVDDNGPTNTNGGNGFGVYRYTPSSGWNLVQGQGSHANYDNNMSDHYVGSSFITYVSVHPTYPTEAHSFRIYGINHNSSCYYRSNSSIGYDNRIGGWENNMFECMELDFTISSASSGAMTRF